MILDSITPLGSAAIIVTLSMAILTGMMFILGKTRVQFVWGFFCLAVTIWIGAFYGAILSKSPDIAEFWWKISYVGVILIPFIFSHFILEFAVVYQKHKRLILSIIYSLASAFVLLDLLTTLIVNGVKFSFNQLYYGQPGALHPYFFGIYVILTFYCFYIVYRKFREKKEDKLFRQQSIFFFISNFIAFTGGSLNFLPIYGISISPITNVSVAIGAALLTYAILRYQLFNARIVMAQLLTLILSSFALARLILSSSLREAIFNLLFLIVTLIVGIYLILSVRKEVEQREELQVANEGQENLIHIMNHQIKGYLGKARSIFAELMNEPEYCAADEAKPMLNEGLRAMTEGVDFVQQVLNGSSAEKGTLTYTMRPLDFKKLVEDAVKNQVGPVAEKGLSMDVTLDEGAFNITGDELQLKEAVRNLIDNSVRYTLHGGLTVRLENEKTGKVLLSVHDTGVGIAPEDKDKLFQKGGRGKDSLKYNVNSTGYGLAFVKGVVDAHKGKVWAESEGPGKGSTFYMELPIT